MSFEFNKLAAAVLMAGIIAMFSGFIARQLFHVEPLHHPAYAIATTGDHGGGTEEPAAPVLEPVLPLLANADVAKGETLYKACATCHTIDQGGANKVGPNLWEIVNRPHAAHPGFSYSPAMQAYAGKPWTYEELNHFIAAPKGYAPGTKMTYPGMKKVQDRADLIAYLRNQAATPAPLPTQEEIDALQKAAAETQGSGDTAAHGATEGNAAEGTGTTEGTAGTTEGATTEGAATTESGSSAGTSGEAATTEGGGSEPAAGATQEAAAPADDGLIQLIAAADPAAGQKAARVCVACHTFEEGGANKVGPNLWGVIGQPFAHLENFNYSAAFKEAHAAGRVWTYAEVDAYLAAPRDFLPGNKMTFAGVKKPEDRASIIAYLRQQSSNPPPLE